MKKILAERVNLFEPNVYIVILQKKKVFALQFLAELPRP